MLGSMRKVLKSLAQFCAGLRFRLLLLVVLVCAPLVALTLHTTSEDHRRAIAGWPQRARKIAQVVSHDEEALILQTRQLLLAVAESSSARTLHSAGCKMMLDPLLAGSPRIKNLGMLDMVCAGAFSCAAPSPSVDELR